MNSLTVTLIPEIKIDNMLRQIFNILFREGVSLYFDYI